MMLLKNVTEEKVEPMDASVLNFPERGPEQPSPAEPKDARRSETIHGRGRDTAHDQRRAAADDNPPPVRSAPAIQPACQRRSEARHVIRRAVVAIPVLPDGSPDSAQRQLGIAVDLSPTGIGLELEAAATFPTTSLVLLLSGPDGEISCAGMEVRYRQPHESGRLRLGGPFGGFGGQILLADNLKPTFRRDTMEFSLGFPEELLLKWAEVGVLQAVLLDRVQLCPKCHGLPTFRQACPICGSAVLTNDRLIHHFACAHVGLVSDFEATGELICPKCRRQHLVVGSDYEYCTGPYRCQSCHWSDTELGLVAQCLRCELRFPAYQAYEHDLRGYLANRLDPLALLRASGFDPEQCG
jgi:hypothetical protein